MARAAFWIAWAWAGLLAVGAAAGTAQAQLKVGVVDLERAMSESKEGKEALARLQKVREEMEGDIRRKQRDLAQQEREARDLRREINQKGPIWREEERRRKEEEFRLKARTFERGREDLQRLVEDNRRDFSDRRNQAVQSIFRDLREVVQIYGQKEGFTLILEKSLGLLFHAKAVEVTDQVIQLYNQRKK